MKRIIIISICILITNYIYFHPGRTDSNGGHYDKSTGEYHYHHGYSAHQHENGECPYDFDDNTNHSPSTGVINKDKVYDLDEYKYYKVYDTSSSNDDESIIDESSEEKEENKKVDIMATISLLLFAFLGSLAIIGEIKH